TCDCPGNHPNNQEAVNAFLPFMHCPSAPVAEDREVSLRGRLTASTGDYTSPGNLSQTSVLKGYGQSFLYDFPYTREAFCAVLNPDKALRIDHVRDGLSQSILAYEVAGRPDHYIAGRLGPTNVSPRCGNPSISGGVVVGAAWADSQSWAAPNGFNRAGTSCEVGMCIINCTNNNEPFAFHPGGLVMVFADGHVDFVTQYVSPEILGSLVTCRRRERISDDWQ
ncbi:DUF1559 family PulG-like putative transporter, partial [Aporhodopirellula aestuarii]